jgi:hypothetical protein
MPGRMGRCGIDQQTVRPEPRLNLLQKAEIKNHFYKEIRPPDIKLG